MASPFTTAQITNIARRLIPPRPPSLTSLPPHTVPYNNRPPVEAAVLIPLMNIKSQPCILMQVRAKEMRSHAGEVRVLGVYNHSFPGGKADSTDKNLIHTALREAEEELALPPSHVEILGMLEPEYSLGNRSRVWPFIGFIHDSSPPFSTSQPLRSLSLSALTPSPSEVSAILPLPLTALLSPTRQSTSLFRFKRSRPYHKIRVEDLVTLPPGFPFDQKQRLEIWGLSGWFINKFAERAGWLTAPVLDHGIDPLTDSEH